MYAEAQIGWIPYVLERADDVWIDPPGLEQLATRLPGAPVQLLRARATS